MTKAWKPKFAPFGAKVFLKCLSDKRQEKADKLKICKTRIHNTAADESLHVWPLAIKKVKIEHKVLIPEVVEPTHKFQPIVPELWQAWMAKEIMSYEILKDKMDYLEAMERRDKVTEALIVLRSEAAQLKMDATMSQIADAGAAILDELWRKGGLGD